MTLLQPLPRTRKRAISCRGPEGIANDASGGLEWGKRGGARVVYLYGSEYFPIFLITAYAKAESGNLSKAEQNTLAKVAKSFFADYGGTG